MSESGNPIRTVSDTALWVAIYRAMESERPDALFNDPYARRLAGERGEAIVRDMPRGRSMAWPMIVRTAVMDEVLVRCVAEGATTIINLAAGLDTRPYRLPLPATLKWVHVDLPPMIDYVREHLAGETPRCDLEYVAADLTDAVQRRDALARAQGPGPALVISEGLLIYLTPEQVAALSREILEPRAVRWWMFDLGSPKLLKMLNKNWGKRLAAGNAPFLFAPAEGTQFFFPHGWREAEFHSTWEDSFRLGRTMPLGGFFRLLSRLMPKKRQEEDRRMSGIVLLERAG